jgi:hypothetical protein
MEASFEPTPAQRTGLQAVKESFAPPAHDLTARSPSRSAAPEEQSKHAIRARLRAARSRYALCCNGRRKAEAEARAKRALEEEKEKEEARLEAEAERREAERVRQEEEVARLAAEADEAQRLAAEEEVRLAALEKEAQEAAKTFFMQRAVSRSRLGKQQWQPNTASCQRCGEHFSFTKRRHHCRQCGACVCDPCSPRNMDLQSGAKQRVCVACEAAVLQLFPTENLGVSYCTRRALQTRQPVQSEGRC